MSTSGTCGTAFTVDRLVPFEGCAFSISRDIIAIRYTRIAMSSRMNVLQQNQEKKVKLFVHAVEREKQKKRGWRLVSGYIFRCEIICQG